jgi:dihydrofolate reductase
VRKVFAGLFISLDGVAERPDQWHFPYFNDEMGEAVTQGMTESDAMLLGRVTYQEWAGYWPNYEGDEDNDFAKYINNVTKYVVSTTLDSVDWKNSHLIKGNLAEELTKLKQQPGKNIAISGSLTLVQSLLRENLLDELRLLVHPIAVGSGKRRLFEDNGPQIPLKLVESKVFTTGVLSLVYQPAKA